MPEYELQVLAIDNIRVDYEIQSRAAMDIDHERTFMEAMLPPRSDRFPPVVVFYDGRLYWLADGFHRVRAARRAGFLDIRCEVHYGSRRDAIIYSAGANKVFSIPRTEADKRKAAYMLFADDEWFRKSAGQIAAHVGVKGGTIIRWRKEFCREKGRPLPATVTRADGTEQAARNHPPGSVWRKDGRYYLRHRGRNVPLLAASMAKARKEAMEILRSDGAISPFAELPIDPVVGDVGGLLNYLRDRDVDASLSERRLAGLQPCVIIGPKARAIAITGHYLPSCVGTLLMWRQLVVGTPLMIIVARHDFDRTRGEERLSDLVRNLDIRIVSAPEVVEAFRRGSDRDDASLWSSFGDPISEEFGAIMRHLSENPDEAERISQALKGGGR